jgi:Fur family ferric uptake transcriptional regulator
MTSRLEKICTERGLKMTDQRRVISRVLSESHDHPDVEEIYRRASMIDPKISIATVYRTIRLYEDANIIERRDFGDGRARYEENREEHHHHLIDVNSGKVIEFQNEELEKLKEKIARDLGYDLIGDRLELYGVQHAKGGARGSRAALSESKYPMPGPGSRKPQKS